MFSDLSEFRKLARKDRRSDVSDQINDHLSRLDRDRRNSAYSFVTNITKAPKTGAFVVYLTKIKYKR